MEHKEKGRRLDLKLAQHLYDMGLPDREIAHCCCVHINTIYRWRHVYGLPPNAETDRATGPNEQLEIDAIAARRHGMTYGQYISQKPLILEAERRTKKKKR